MGGGAGFVAGGLGWLGWLAWDLGGMDSSGDGADGADGVGARLSERVLGLEGAAVDADVWWTVGGFEGSGLAPEMATGA